jgi:atypical dual specificity phosphatase
VIVAPARFLPSSSLPPLLNLRYFFFQNLGGVISLNESHENTRTFSVAEWAERGITNKKYDIADHIGAASVAQVREMVEFIMNQEEGGKTVYVHCKAGKGRSASVVMCYLCQKHSVSPDEAFKMLKEKRKQIDLGSKQWSLVRNYCIEILNRTKCD